MIKRLLPLVLVLGVGAAPAADDELLPADDAFQLTANADASTITARWRIAPGYYLYRNKFKFEALDPGVRLGAPAFPPGKIKQDRYFGPSEIYLHDVVVRIPYHGAEAGAALRLRVTAQGCNEPIGVCYPPIVKEITLAPAGTAASARSFLNAKSSRAAGALAAFNADIEPVDPDKAFRVEALGLDAHTVAVRFTIDECCYLYRDKTRFSLTAADGGSLAAVRLEPVELPNGEAKTDEYVGRTEVYRRSLDLRLRVRGSADRFALNVTYQGCSDKGVSFCYEPRTVRFPMAHEGDALVVGAAQTLAAPPATPIANPSGTAQSRAGDWFWAIIGAFGAGLLLTFTPCVLPLVPILSGALVGVEGTRLTKLRGAGLSYTYVLGTALTYAAAGAVAGATGEQLQAYFQNAWAIGIFCSLLVLFALSMFGLYELQMPHAIQSFLHHHSTHVHAKAKRWVGGEFVGVLLLGMLSALIVGACVTPVLASVLAGAIATQDPLRGAAILFALAHGQGALLVVIGVTGGSLLPRTGPWMNTVKHIFGVLLIAVAIYLLGLLPQVPVLLLWGALFIVCAVYLGATQALPKEANGWRYLWKGVGTLLLVWGILALVGGFAGERDLLRPLPAGTLTAMVAKRADGGDREMPGPLFRRVTTLAELDQELARARRAGKPVVLDYYATWCTDCVRMERSTLSEPSVRAAIAARFVAVQADVTETDENARAVKQRFHVYGPPAMLFFSPSGVELPALRAYGYRSADQLLETLSKIPESTASLLAK